MILPSIPTREGKKGRTHKIEKGYLCRTPKHYLPFSAVKSDEKKKTPKASAKRQKIGKSAAAGNRKREGVFFCLGARKER